MGGLKPTPCVALWVIRYPEAFRFYSEVLGLEVIQSSQKGAEFRWNGLSLFIEEDRGLTPRGKGNFHLEFEAEDFEQSLRMLQEEGCIIAESYGPQSVLLADPFGMYFHLYQKGIPLPGLSD